MPVKPVLYGGLACGILDISYAFTRWGMRGIRPERILYSVASGLLGKGAAQGGAGTAALGLLLHFTVALLAAVGFWILWRLLPIVRAWPAVSGAAYGAFWYFWMNHVVVPLSKARPPTDNPTDLFFHILLVGLPIGLAYKLSNATLGNP